MRIYTRSHFNPYDYGYGWWQRELNGYSVQFAWGNGGQYIVMIPALKTVAAIVSRSGESFPIVAIKLSCRSEPLCYALSRPAGRFRFMTAVTGVRCIDAC